MGEGVGGGSEEYFCLPGKLKSYFSVTLLCECIGFEIFWRVRYTKPLTSFSVHSYMTANALFNTFIKKKSFIHFALLFVLHVGKNTPLFFPRLRRNRQGRECTCSWEILATQRTVHWRKTLNSSQVYKVSYNALVTLRHLQ